MLAQYFSAVGCHSNLAVAMYAVDSLRQVRTPAPCCCNPVLLPGTCGVAVLLWSVQGRRHHARAHTGFLLAFQALTFSIDRLS